MDEPQAYLDIYHLKVPLKIILAPGQINHLAF